MNRVFILWVLLGVLTSRKGGQGLLCYLRSQLHQHLRLDWKHLWKTEAEVDKCIWTPLLNSVLLW